MKTRHKTRLDVKALYNAHNIDHITGTHRHARPGWIQTVCPFCTGNPGHHLGYSIEDDYYNCWRCGFKRHIDAVAALCNVTETRAVALLIEFGSRRVKSTEHTVARESQTFVYPFDSHALNDRHREYLRARDFDPDALVARYSLRGTGHTGAYKFRIIAPIIVNNRIVSYQGRDITGKHNLKYKSCARVNESVHHKHTLYNIDRAERDFVVVCEGVFDVFRLGDGAVATFGIKYTQAQLLLLSEFQRVFVLFDSSDAQADKQAKKLSNALNVLGVDSNIVIETKWNDPAEMPQQSADEMMQQLRRQR